MGGGQDDREFGDQTSIKKARVVWSVDLIVSFLSTFTSKFLPLLTWSRQIFAPQRYNYRIIMCYALVENKEIFKRTERRTPEVEDIMVSLVELLKRER
jgi:hypothetical protein